jgi:formate hydrogenlyase subunit 4
LGGRVTAVASLVLHAALMMTAAPLLAGLRVLARARLLGRAGPSLIQPWRDLARLVRKQPVLPDTASWLFTCMPFVCLAAAVVAALLVPSFALGMPTAPLSDLVVLAGLLALARYALALAGYDTGTAVGGMGATRITLVAVWGEPSVLLIILVLASLAGSSNLDAIGATLSEQPQGVLWLAAGAALAIVGFMLTGPGRDAAQLTLVHEAAMLDYSGRYLAMVAYAGQLGVLVWLSLLAALFIPFGMASGGAGLLAWAFGIAAWGLKVGALGVCLAVLDAVTAGPGITRVPVVLGMTALLIWLAAVFVFASQRLA